MSEGEIIEPRGTHFTLILSQLAMLGDIAEAHRDVASGGGKVVGGQHGRATQPQAYGQRNMTTLGKGSKTVDGSVTPILLACGLAGGSVDDGSTRPRI